MNRELSVEAMDGTMFYVEEEYRYGWNDLRYTIKHRNRAGKSEIVGYWMNGNTSHRTVEYHLDKFVENYNNTLKSNSYKINQMKHIDHKAIIRGNINKVNHSFYGWKSEELDACRYPDGWGWKDVERHYFKSEIRKEASLVEEKEVWRGEIKSPTLSNGEKIYIEELDTDIIILERIRTPGDTVVYRTDYEISRVDIEEEEESLRAAKEKKMNFDKKIEEERVFFESNVNTKNFSTGNPRSWRERAWVK